MGMFDEVSFWCGKCDESTIAQSKSGECTLATYAAVDVPIDVVAGLPDLVICKECGRVLWERPGKERINLMEARDNG